MNVFTVSPQGMNECKADVVLVIESSTRISGGNNTEIMNFVTNLVYGLQLSDNNARVGAISYNKGVQLVVS